MQRDKSVDIAKGIGIILSIFGHINHSILNAFIYMFHMPLFYFISGYLFNPDKYSFKQYVVRKLKTIILPYFIFGIITLLFNYLLHEKVAIVDFLIQKRYLTLWFLTSLFFTEIVFYLLNKFIKNEYLKGIIVILLFLVGNVLSNIIDIALPWNFDSICFTLVYYFLGYSFKKYKDVILKREKIINIASLILLPIIFLMEVKLFNKPVDIFHNKYGIFPLNIISGLCGIFIIMRISSYLVKVKLLSKVLGYIGENSLIFFAFQGIPILLINKLFAINKLILNLNFVPYNLITVIELVVILVVLSLLNELFRLLKIKKIYSK